MPYHISKNGTLPFKPGFLVFFQFFYFAGSNMAAFATGNAVKRFFIGVYAKEWGLSWNLALGDDCHGRPFKNGNRPQLSGCGWGVGLNRPSPTCLWGHSHTILFCSIIIQRFYTLTQHDKHKLFYILCEISENYAPSLINCQTWHPSISAMTGDWYQILILERLV